MEVFLNKFLFILLYCLLNSTISFSQTFDLAKANQEIAQRILSTMNNCGDKIWPKFSLNDLNIVLVDKSIENQIAVSTLQNKIISFPKKLLPDSALNYLYYFFKIDNQSWMAINPIRWGENPEVDYNFVVTESFKLALHEGFHQSIQKNWKSSSDGSRGTIVPIAWEPRFYRSMIFKNLLTVYKSNFFQHTALRRAKYWYDLWTQKYPMEVGMTTDGYEGSASFAELLGDTFSKFGCENYNKNANDYIAGHIVDGRISFLNGEMFALDVEGYLVGLVAGLILRQQNVIPNWQERLANGETPLVQLMTLVTPKFQPIDNDAMTEKFIQTQQKEQAKVDSFLGETYKNIANSQSVYISVPSSWAPSTFSPIEFYYDPALKLELTPMATDFHFNNTDTSSKLVSKTNAVYIGVESNPCKQETDGYWLFIVSSNEVSQSNSNRIEVKNKLFEGSLGGELVTDSRGFKWFCAGVNGHKK